MKKKHFWTALAATLTLAACPHHQPTQTEELNRTTLEASFEQVECRSFEHHLLDSLRPYTFDTAVTGALVGEPVRIGLFASYAENQQGARVYWFRDLPYFVIQDTTGELRAYSDFRKQPLPQAVGEKGHDLILKEAVSNFCSTQAGMIGDTWMALITPELRCSDWGASGGERCIDFYALSDGRYLGSTALPESPVASQWVQAVEMLGDEMHILFSDRQSGSDCHYHVQFNIPNE